MPPVTSRAAGRWAAKSAKLLPQLSWGPRPPPAGSWEEIVARNHYLAAYTNRPYYLLNYAYEALPERGGSSAAEARDRFVLAAQVSHGLPRPSTTCHDLPRPATTFHDLPRASTSFHDLP